MKAIFYHFLWVIMTAESTEGLTSRMRNGTTNEHYAGGEPCKFVDSRGRFLNLYGRLYGPYRFRKHAIRSMFRRVYTQLYRHRTLPRHRGRGGRPLLVCAVFERRCMFKSRGWKWASHFAEQRLCLRVCRWLHWRELRDRAGPLRVPTAR